MAIPNKYPNANKVRVYVEFRDVVTKQLFNPSVVTIKTRDPAGTIVTKVYPDTVVNDATGKYHLDVSVAIVGRWRYTGIGDSARIEGYFDSEPSLFDV